MPNIRAERIPRPLDQLPDPLMPEEVAEVLRVGPTTVYGLLRAGKLRFLPVGTKRPRKLIYKVDLLAYIAAGKMGGAS
jgi:excisionase family DNA binding protein